MERIANRSGRPPRKRGPMRVEASRLVSLQTLSARLRLLLSLFDHEGALAGASGWSRVGTCCCPKPVRRGSWWTHRLRSSTIRPVIPTLRESTMADGETSRNVNCGDCGLDLPAEWSSCPDDHQCPACGSMSKHVELNLVSTLPLPRDYLSYAVKDHNYPASRNPRKEVLNRPTFSRDDGRMRDEHRTIDKYKNEYHKVITDQETGEIVYERHEPLTEHQGHGSAKRRSDARRNR